MILLSVAAHAAGCQPTSLATVAATEAPAAIVLGERRGLQPDLARARRLIARLRATGQPVTVAVQAVDAAHQPVLDRALSGEVEPADLEGLLDFDASWGVPFGPYRALLLDTPAGGRAVAVGAALELPPDDAPVFRAPGYTATITDALGEPYMPATLEGPFARSVAWLEHRVAAQAASAWDGQGFLVLLADRLHVEGGKGVAWQLARTLDAPVSSLNLARPGACFEGDRYLP